MHVAQWNEYFNQKYGESNVRWLTEFGNNPYFHVPILGAGSTGRIVLNDLIEEMAIDGTKSEPFTSGASTYKITDNIGDKRWSGWEKWQVIYETSKGRSVNIHFNYNPKTGYYDDFKFN